MKKLLVLTLCFAMVMGLSVNALAETEPENDEEYTTEYEEYPEETVYVGKDWRPVWMLIRPEITEVEKLLWKYCPQNEGEERINPLAYLLDNYNADIKKYEDVYGISCNQFYIMRVPFGTTSFKIDQNELVMVHRTFEKQTLFGTQRTADFTIVRTGERLTLPIGGGMGYSLHRVYRVPAPERSQTLRDLNGWER